MMFLYAGDYQTLAACHKPLRSAVMDGTSFARDLTTVRGVPSAPYTSKIQNRVHTVINWNSRCSQQAKCP